MASPASAALERRRFHWALAAWTFLTLTFTILLLPAVPLATRESASALGLLIAGVIAAMSGAFRASRSEGAERRPWLLMVLGGIVGAAGNAWVAITGADPVSSPSLVSNISIAAALVISTLALLAFPSMRRRGAEWSVMFLDGLVAGGALLLIASVLVYSQLLNSPSDHGGSDRIFALVFPVLDVVLATVAVLLVVRASRTDRLKFGLLAAAFLLYAASDLAFAVRIAQEDFHFGTLLDLGWIAAYLTLSLAAWVPARKAQGEADEISWTV